jgi:hypothetical protein
MAKLAFCKVCKATYPLAVVQHDGGRSGKTKVPTCPMGHIEIEQLDAPPKRGKSKKQ